MLEMIIKYVGYKTAAFIVSAAMVIVFLIGSAIYHRIKGKSAKQKHKSVEVTEYTIT